MQEQGYEEKLLPTEVYILFFIRLRFGKINIGNTYWKMTAVTDRANKYHQPAILRISK
jgi:hypothetical protein